MELFAFGIGFVLLAAIWVLYGLVGGTWNPLALVIGADNRPSTSKLQFFLWTVVVLYAYGAIWAARFWHGQMEAISNIPPNLLLAMGFSLTTVTAAKGITSAYVSSGRLVKNPPPTDGSPTNATANSATGVSAIATDDDGFPDLSKMQMLAWTLVAIGVFLVAVVVQVSAARPQLPDIDASLMVLMGLGQGAYLGKKLVTTDVPRLTGLVPGGGVAGTTVVTLTGAGFGDQQGANLITFDGFPVYAPALSWSDGTITFTIPAQHPGGGDWPSSRTAAAGAAMAANPPVRVGLIVHGNECPNTLPLTVTAPGPDAPPPPPQNQTPGIATVPGSQASNQPPAPSQTA
ncbi:MAG TPA: IPT/TIG domain-containing protein [Chloroflexia bacterium]|jgi:hypothetical protein